MYNDASSIMNSTWHDNLWHEIVHYEFYAIVDEYESGMAIIDNDTANTNSHSVDFEYKSKNQSNYDCDAIECGYKMTDTTKNSNSHMIINIANNDRKTYAIIRKYRIQKIHHDTTLHQWVPSRQTTQQQDKQTGLD